MPTEIKIFNIIMNSFSYLEYQAIIENLRSSHTLMDFSEVDSQHSEYGVIRHDVEFSLDRALNLAVFEANTLNLHTSYLFQLRNNCYNLLSDRNINKLHKIKELGHSVGLHYHLHAMKDKHQIQDSILEEADIFKKVTGIKVDRFSYHRPPQDILKQYLSVDGLINCYGKPFFQYYETPHNNLNIKYFTDSRHEWKHGYPIDSQFKKIQLLTHPYSWTQSGAANFENYQELLHEKSKELTHSINAETSTFPSELLID